MNEINKIEHDFFIEYTGSFVNVVSIPNFVETYKVIASVFNKDKQILPETYKDTATNQPPLVTGDKINLYSGRGEYKDHFEFIDEFYSLVKDNVSLVSYSINCTKTGKGLKVKHYTCEIETTDGLGLALSFFIPVDHLIKITWTVFVQNEVREIYEKVFDQRFKHSNLLSVYHK